jgi:hypothetical protein
MFTSSANLAKIKREIVVLTVNLFYVALDHWDSPTHWKFIIGKHT